MHNFFCPTHQQCQSRMCCSATAAVAVQITWAGATPGPVQVEYITILFETFFMAALVILQTYYRTGTLFFLLCPLLSCWWCCDSLSWLCKPTEFCWALVDLSGLGFSKGFPFNGFEIENFIKILFCKHTLGLGFLLSLWCCSFYWFKMNLGAESNL